MDFPSVPFYLDPPNWNQHQAQQPGSGGGGGGSDDAHQLPPGAAMAGQIRPGSMADRARLAKLPQHPEPALKCPRCDSSNTKFCYFNNYSLSQPRHFCKTCRRYWTRGGSLRTVPVGGGCRRNKRSKSSGSTSKSQNTATADHQFGATPTTTAPPPQLQFMANLHHLSDYAAPNIGMSFGGIQPIDAVECQVGGGSSLGLEQWRLQQFQHFPFFGGLEAPAPAPELYPFDGEVGIAGQVNMKASSAPGIIKQMASVKMEDNSHGINLARQFMGVPRNDQYWGGSGSGGGWMTDLSGFNSSSSGNLS